MNWEVALMCLVPGLGKLLWRVVEMPNGAGLCIWMFAAWSLMSFVVVISAVMSNKLIRKGWEEYEHYWYE